MWRGDHINSDSARRLTFNTLRVEGEAPFKIQMDGEPRGSAQLVDIKVHARALKLLTPPGAMDLLKPK
jgi:diacylglycerol kinase family enzyme